MTRQKLFRIRPDDHAGWIACYSLRILQQIRDDLAAIRPRGWEKTWRDERFLAVKKRIVELEND